MTEIISKLKVEHPLVNEATGAALHTYLRSIYIKIGDNMNGRLLTTGTTLTTGNNVDLEHNLLVHFNYLNWKLFIRDNVTDDLTYVDSGGIGGTPDLNLFTVAGTPGSETTHIRLSNNSGDPSGAKFYALVVTLGPKIFTPRYIDAGPYYTRPGDIVHADSSLGPYNLVLPPVGDCIPGTRVEVLDPTGNHNGTPITLDRNGQNINGAAANWVLNIDNKRTIIEYINNSLDWRTF